MKITAALIASRDPVVGQSEAFRRVFGDGPARITDEIALDHAETFDWPFLAEEFLSDAGLEKYYAAEKKAEREWQAAETKIDVADKIGNQTAYVKYQRALARAFAEIYSKENPE
jgi:hypothetical protein